MKQETTKFTFTYEFNAPRELVFGAFSDAGALNEWWGPAETENSVVSLDFRVGGIFHFKMMRDGKASYGRFLFRTIRPCQLLEFTNAFADEQANVVDAPFGFQFPREIFYRLEFADAGKGKTLVTLTGYPVNASPEEEAGFRSINADMEQGFGKTFGKLRIYLQQITH